MGRSRGGNPGSRAPRTGPPFSPFDRPRLRVDPKPQKTKPDGPAVHEGLRKLAPFPPRVPQQTNINNNADADKAYDAGFFNPVRPPDGSDFSLGSAPYTALEHQKGSYHNMDLDAQVQSRGLIDTWTPDAAQYYLGSVHGSTSTAYGAVPSSIAIESFGTDNMGHLIDPAILGTRPDLEFSSSPAFKDATSAENSQPEQISCSQAAPEPTPQPVVELRAWMKYKPPDGDELVIVDMSIRDKDGDYNRCIAILDARVEVSLIKPILVKDLLRLGTLPWPPPVGGRDFLTCFGGIHSDTVVHGEIWVKNLQLGVAAVDLNMSIMSEASADFVPVECIFGQVAIQKFVDGSRQFADTYESLCGKSRSRRIRNPWKDSTALQPPLIQAPPGESSMKYLTASSKNSRNSSTQDNVAPLWQEQEDLQKPQRKRRRQREQPRQPQSQRRRQPHHQPPSAVSHGAASETPAGPSTIASAPELTWSDPTLSATQPARYTLGYHKPDNVLAVGGGPKPLPNGSSFHDPKPPCTVDQDLRGLRPPGSFAETKSVLAPTVATPPTMYPPYSQPSYPPSAFMNTVDMFDSPVQPCPPLFMTSNERPAYVGSQGYTSPSEADSISTANGPCSSLTWMPAGDPDIFAGGEGLRSL